ncbi:MAG: PHP domain-containing protein [bacterium]
MTLKNDCADLHLHTNRSDGYCSPKEVVDEALAHGLVAVAIVDHDEISALDEAITYGKARGLEVIPGVELSVNYRNLDLHLLGYCIDYRNAGLLKYLNTFKNERLKRTERIVRILTKMGMPISFEAVLKKAGPGSVGRPHIADVLVDEGYVFSFQEAFDKYIGHGKPAYVAKYKIDVASAIRLIHSAGGVCSVAHPGLDMNKEDLIMLIKSGVNGIEAIHPKHNKEQARFFSEIARKNGLLITGGSDYHGGRKGNAVLGQFTVSYEVVNQLKEFSSAS